VLALSVIVARISLGSFPATLIVPASRLLYSRITMADHTETLKIGDRAPEFVLPAANREGMVSLSGSLTRGSVMVEFLRGTW
jgi:hypothetical protein